MHARIFWITSNPTAAEESIPDSKPHPSSKSSEDTLIRAKGLDAVTLSRIHDRYYPLVYRYVRFRLNDDPACEDICAEVFLQLLNALHRQRGPVKNLRGWLFGTASNLVNDHLRKRYRRPQDRIKDGEHLSDHLHPDQSYEDAWQRERVHSAIGELTPEQQHVLALRFAEEYSLEETAGAMRKSVNAIKALQFRAIAALRRILEDN
jgi:RNA polymerase sigma-70 factor (ECF subfamily)